MIEIKVRSEKGKMSEQGDNWTQGFVIATEKNKTIGSLQFVSIGNEGIIQFMSVEPKQRSKGIGKQMVTEFERFACENKITKITGSVGFYKYGDIPKAIKFWQREGYKVDSARHMLKTLTCNLSVQERRE